MEISGFASQKQSQIQLLLQQITLLESENYRQKTENNRRMERLLSPFRRGRKNRSFEHKGSSMMKGLDSHEHKTNATNLSDQAYSVSREKNTFLQPGKHNVVKRNKLLGKQILKEREQLAQIDLKLLEMGKKREKNLESKRKQEKLEKELEKQAESNGLFGNYLK